MPNNLIKNFDDLATTSERRLALQIVEAGLAAVNTAAVIADNLSLENHILKIKADVFDLRNFKKIYVIGFGKAACDATLAINRILKDKITAGIAVDIKTASCENSNIKIYQGSHPKPSAENLAATKRILDIAKQATAGDLVICIVSGGGSALLCNSVEECNLSNLIFDQFLKSGGSINELNILRKHLPSLKGGRLAQIFQNSTMINLIFSDIPGGQIEDVASGPTFLDRSTLSDVKAIIDKYHLQQLANLPFTETPKNEKIFARLHNILLVSNHQALQAMSDRAIALNLKPKIISANLSVHSNQAAEIMTGGLETDEVRLSGGEVRIVSKNNSFGKGGRNTQTVLETVPLLNTGEVFVSIASDGIDNSDAAGAIADGRTKTEGEDYRQHLEALNSYPYFEKLNDLIFTGPTGSNVADLAISLKL